MPGSRCPNLDKANESLQLTIAQIARISMRSPIESAVRDDVLEPEKKSYWVPKTRGLVQTKQAEQDNLTWEVRGEKAERCVARA